MKPHSRMTVREAENIIRKMKNPETEEDTEQYRQAAYTIFRAIQCGYGVVPIHWWKEDIKDELKKMAMDKTKEDMAREFLGHALMLECIIAEAVATDGKELDEIIVKIEEKRKKKEQEEKDDDNPWRDIPF